MVGISRVSTYGTLAGNLQTLRRQQETFSLKASQLNTGQQYSTLIEYREQISQILVFQQDINGKTATIDRLTIAETVIRNYDTTLEGFDDRIDTLQRIIEDSRGFNSDINPELYQRWREQNSEYFDNFLRDVNDLINTRVGGRYIYSGSAYNTRPIRDLSAEPLPATANPAAFTLLNRDQIPSYATLSPVPAPIVPPVDARIDDGQFISLDASGVSYGETFTHEGFQRLFTGFLHFKTALERPVESERISFLDEAASLLTEAKNQLQILREREAFNLQLVTQAQSDFRTERNLQENFLAAITQISPEEVTVEISALRNQIEATYRTISVQDRLSIANFLFG